MQTTVRLRKHASNYSGDQVANLIGRVNVLMLGPLGHPDIYADFFEEVIEEARAEVLRAYQRALWYRRYLWAGQLYGLLAPFGLRAPKFKQRLAGVVFSFWARMQTNSVPPKLRAMIALALRNQQTLAAMARSRSS